MGGGGLDAVAARHYTPSETADGLLNFSLSATVHNEVVLTKWSISGYVKPSAA